MLNQHPPGISGRFKKKLTEGKTRTEAIRCLKRHLARTIYNLMTTDHTNHQATTLPTAA